MNYSPHKTAQQATDYEDVSKSGQICYQDADKFACDWCSFPSFL